MDSGDDDSGEHLILAKDDYGPQQRGDADMDGPKGVDDKDDFMTCLPCAVESQPSKPLLEKQPKGTAPQPIRVRALRKPTEPSRADREKHELTHLPFEEWCRHCVMARSQCAPHRKSKKHSDAKEVPVMSGDFCFMGREEQVGTNPIFVMRDHATRKTFAHMVVGKSTSREEYSAYLVNAVLRDIEHMGHKKMVFKTDQESAMVALQERIRQSRSDPTVLENSPVEQSQANGVVEKAVQEIEGMVRTLVSALEERIRWRIPHDSPIMGWIVEYAAVLINLFRVGRDHKTPNERHKGGERNIRPIAEFGESVFYRPLGVKKEDMNKMGVPIRAEPSRALTPNHVPSCIGTSILFMSSFLTPNGL